MAGEKQEFRAVEREGGWWRFVPLALIATVIAAIFATGLHRQLSFEAFFRYQAWLQDLVVAHRFKMLAIYMLVYVTAVTLSLPASAFLTIIGGYLFGWLTGAIVASTAATVGACGIFLITRTSLGGPLLRRAGTRVQTLASGFRRQAFSYLLFLRLMPVVPFWVTNLAAAFFGMRLKTFALATQIGMIPVSLAFAFIGSGLDEVIARQEELRAQCLAAAGGECGLHVGARSLLTPELMTALGFLGVLALAPVAVRYWRTRR